MPYPIAPLPLHLQRALTILIRLATFVENERKSYGVEDGSAFDLDDVESGSFWEEARAWSVRRRRTMGIDMDSANWWRTMAYALRPMVQR
jgi:hypothetical protein